MINIDSTARNIAAIVRRNSSDASMTDRALINRRIDTTIASYFAEGDPNNPPTDRDIEGIALQTAMILFPDLTTFFSS